MYQQAWWFDERTRCGVDYSDDQIAKNYDGFQTQLHDYNHEAVEIVTMLELHSGHTLIDMGTGTGNFAIQAAPLCHHVFAVDISKSMLDVARTKAKNHQVRNISFIQAGFLTYQHEGEPVDCVVTTAALHHLPDFWKLVALQRIANILRPGGKLFLQDVVFPTKASTDPEILDAWLSGMGQLAGKTMAREATLHIMEEYSTYNWILEGMLEKAGFHIQYYDYSNHLVASYLCVKKGGGGL